MGVSRQSLCCFTGEIAEEEVLFTLFNLAQFLGYIEVVRREGPREDAFLQAGNPQGSDTLATLVEGLRFVMSAASGNLVVSAIAGGGSLALYTCRDVMTVMCHESDICAHKMLRLCQNTEANPLAVMHCSAVYGELSR